MHDETPDREHSRRSSSEISDIEKLKEFHKNHLDSWGDSWNSNALSTLQRLTLSRILYYDALYRKIIGVPGNILEFGVQLGGNFSPINIT